MNILLLDGNYPFLGGESFLENEIVSGIFERDTLYIAPMGRHRDTEEMRSIPPNAILVHTVAKSMAAETAAIIYAAISTLFRKDIWMELLTLIRERRFNLKRLADLLKFLLSSNMRYFHIKKHFEHIASPQTLVYSYWMNSGAYIAARFKEKYSNIFFVSRCHGGDLYEERAAANYMPMRSYIFQYADRIFPISKNGVKYLRDKYGNVVDGKLTLSYLGTHDRGLSYASEDGVLRIVSCSYLIPLKRVHLLIQSLSLIKNTVIQWTHYGDGKLRKELEAQADRSLPANIHWRFAGELKNEDLMEQYTRDPVDLFINVSESEGLPVSIMEAMSFGIPVIATDVGGTSEIVQQEKNGFLLEKNFKPEELAALICQFASGDDEYRNRLRMNARSTWEESFNAEKNYRKFYEELICISSGRSAHA